MSNVTSRQVVVHSVAWIAGVVILIVAAQLLKREPTLCHWIPPYYRSIYASILLNIPDEEWGRFRSVLADIGQDAHLSIKDRSQLIESRVDVLEMSLCAADGRSLLVHDYPSVGSRPECRRDCGVTVFVYGRADLARQLTLDVSRRLDETWPSRVSTQVHTK